MTPPAPAPRLRPARAEDGAFLDRLFAEEAGALLRAAGLSPAEAAPLIAMQARAREAAYRARYPDALYGIVTCGADPVGRYVEARLPGTARVVDLAIALPWRRRGLARTLLREAIAGWATDGRDGEASVAIGNAASLALFTGLGFTGRAEPGAAQIHLVWRAGSGRADP